MTYDFNVPRSVIEHIIDEWCLNARYREILKLRYLDGLTYEEIAEKVLLSTRQVKNIVYKEGDKVLRRIPKHYC